MTIKPDWTIREVAILMGRMRPDANRQESQEAMRRTRRQMRKLDLLDETMNPAVVWTTRLIAVMPQLQGHMTLFSTDDDM